MADLILSIIFISSILMFGVFVSAAFCGIEQNRKNNTVLFIYFAVTAVVQFAMYISPIEWIIQGLYPVMMHLPLALLLIFYFKKKALTAVSAIVSAYLCCSLSEWVGLLGQTFTNSEIVYYVIRISLTWALFYVLIKYAARSISAILCRDTKTILIFSIMSAAYYIFDYASTIYTKLLYSNDPAVYEFLPFLMCISYLYFCTVYFKEYEEKSETLRRNQMLKLKTDETMHKIEITKTKEMETARLRHDMRHYLAAIASLAG